MGASVPQAGAKGLPSFQKSRNLCKFLSSLTAHRSFCCQAFPCCRAVAGVFTPRPFIYLINYLFAPVHVAKTLGWLAWLAAVCGLSRCVCLAGS